MSVLDIECIVYWMCVLRTECTLFIKVSSLNVTIFIFGT